MNRLELPLSTRKLIVTGETLLSARLHLDLKTNQQSWRQAIFLYDSGTEMTCMSAWRARGLGLPMPIQPTRGLNHRQSQLEIRVGVLRAQVVGMDATEYVFPCYFVGDPNVALGPTSPAFLRHNLLSLTGVVDKLRLITEDTRDPAFPVGKLIVEKI